MARKDAPSSDLVWQDKMFGEVAVDLGVVTPEQVLESLDVQVLLQRHAGQKIPLGAILLIRGALSVEQLRRVLHELGAPKEETNKIGPRVLFGRILVERGYVTPKQLLQALDVQARDIKRGRAARPIGEILLSQGLLRREQLQDAVRIQEAYNKERKPAGTRGRKARP